jgi:hypothetical protein
MNAEQLQQLYGGDISDYIKPANKDAMASYDPSINSDLQLETIYNTQVKSKGSINVTNNVLNLNINSLIERPEADPIQDMFQRKLNELANDIDLTGDSGYQSYNSNYTPTLKAQTASDAQAAMDLVARAIAELKELEAL